MLIMSFVTIQIPFMSLAAMPNGSKSLSRFMSGGRNRREQTFHNSSKDELTMSRSIAVDSGRTRRHLKLNGLRNRRKSKQNLEEEEEEEQEEDENDGRRRSGRATRSKGLKQAQMLSYVVPYGSDDDLLDFGKRSSRSSTRHKTSRRRRRDDLSDESEEEHHIRKSGRDKRQKQSYIEAYDDNDDSSFVRPDAGPRKSSKPQVFHSKEIFPVLEEDDEFAKVHSQTCDACGYSGYSRERGHLVYCQGCSLTYHKACIGHRSGREHLVTKISSEKFVLQCRRCVGRVKAKDPSQASLNRCVDCASEGRSCDPFSNPGKKATVDADGNREHTPQVEVPEHLLYNPKNVLFRCEGCYRAWHYNHLPARSTKNKPNIPAFQQRVDEYCYDFKCDLCVSNIGNKINNIIAWRPSEKDAQDQDDKDIPVILEDYDEDEREYLVRFENQSYFQAQWVPGSWVAGRAPQLRAAYMKKKYPAKMRTEDAIDEEWLRIEIVLDVEYTSIVPLGKDVEVDLARIEEVSRALVKFRGLTYEDVVWEVPPEEGEHPERYVLWRTAYENFIHGIYVHLPKNVAKKVEKARATDFKNLEQKTQPAYIKGGQLMNYQMEGMKSVCLTITARDVLTKAVGFTTSGIRARTLYWLMRWGWARPFRSYRISHAWRRNRTFGRF